MVPPPAAVATPVKSTTATSVSPLDHVTSASAITRPAWSRTSAVSCTVCPSAVNLTVSGFASMVVGSAETTVSSESPVTPDPEAVTTAWPSAMDSTSPASSTRATKVSLDIHENWATATGWPFASAASATRRVVSPNATRVSTAGDTATVLTSCATVTVAVPEAEPDVAEIDAVPLAVAVTCPEASTAATEASLDDHATTAAAIT